MDEPRLWPKICVEEDDIYTEHGVVRVVVEGDRKKTPMITYHDIGLDSNACFRSFFDSSDMKEILQHFCVYHINAPGQQENATTLPITKICRACRGSRVKSYTSKQQILDTATADGNCDSCSGQKQRKYAYPTMDELAEMILTILDFYSVKSVIGFGVGAGANILARFALNHPDIVDGIVLINCTSSRAGWAEWAQQKLNVWHLGNGHLTMGVEEYLLWHWFGSKTMYERRDVVISLQDFVTTLNPYNLGLFIESYLSRLPRVSLKTWILGKDLLIILFRRTDLGLVKDNDNTNLVDVKNFRCPVMLVTGDYSPHLYDTVGMNEKVDPRKVCFIKYDCGGMVLREVPQKVAESFMLFMQGLSHAACLHLRKDPNCGIIRVRLNSKCAIKTTKDIKQNEDEKTTAEKSAICTYVAKADS